MFALLVLLSVYSSTLQATLLTRVELDDPKARCLDGSPYSYYISESTTAKTKFYINHQGGGWCQDLNECAQRAQGALGSSKSWGPNVNFGESFSREKNQNPLMFDWVLVYLPYCDGGSFTGNAMSDSDPSDPSAAPLYFYGLGIREAVAKSLREKYGFADATDLVVGGCSAGGLAAYIHVDWWAHQVPKAVARGLPDSGFFLDGDYNRDGKPNYEARMANLYKFMNSSAGISSTCTSRIGYKCLFAYHLMPFIESPVLALNSAYDATMGNGQCGHSGITFNWNDAKSVNECGNYIRGLFKELLAEPSAVFLDSCRHHCGEWGAITIDGLKSPEVLQLWYEKGTKGLPHNGYMDQNQVFPCDSCCKSK